VRNGFKVGPNYGVPAGSTAEHWIDEADVRLRKDEVPSQWWTLFGDKTLDGLIECAASQNLSLREASFRVLSARMQVAIAKGTLFPQQQDAAGGFSRNATRATTIDVDAPALTGRIGTQTVVLEDLSGPVFFLPRTEDQWSFGFGLAWEIDFWGRLRRAVTSAENTLDASIYNYQDVLVTLLGDVAATYVQIRTLQQRIRLVQANVELQRSIMSIAQRRFKAGARNELDVAQAGSTLDQTESAIPQLQAELRDACNRMCVLLGVPPVDLEKRLGEGPIPTAPAEVIVGIPADLLRRRPDVRRAERLAAAQAERIGIAEAAIYPTFALNESIGWSSADFPGLFTSQAMSGSFGPAFQWNILNYGRLRNNVRLQDARFQESVANYQNTALRAGAEVESAIVRFLRAHDVARLMDRSVASAQKAADIVARQYKEGDVDFNRIALIEQTLVDQQDRQARAHGAISQGLIEVYRAAGGGWEAPIPERSFEEIPAAAPSEWTTPEEATTAPMPK
jgi:NodT family efflux transporter outer membrane factor (OMF) lipoprotein